MKKRGLWLFLIFVYFAFFAGSVYSDRVLALRVIYHLLTTVLLGTWLVGLLLRGRGIPRTSLDWPVLAWLAASLLAALAGLCPRFSLERCWLFFAYALGLYLFVDLQRRGWHSAVFQTLFLTAAVVCMAGLFEWFSWYFGLPFLPHVVQSWTEIGGWKDLVPPTFHRLNATLGGSTPLAAYLAVIIPPCIGWMLTVRGRQERLGLSGLLVAAFLTEVLAFSRGGVLSLAVSLPLTVAGWVAAQSHWRDALRRRLTGWGWRRMAVVLLVLASAVALGGLWLSRSFAGRGASTMFRFTLWQVAAKEFLAHPWTGVGPANFGRALLKYNDGALPRHQITAAHNVYLNTAAEMGLLGLLTGGWLLVLVVWGWARRWRGAGCLAERVRIASCGAALAGFAAQQLVDTFYAPANWLPVLALAAFALTPTRQHPGEVRARSWQSAVALGVLFLFSMWLGWTDVAQYHFERSVQLAGRGEFDRAVQQAEAAQRKDPSLALYAFQSGYVRGMWAARDGEPTLIAQAIEDYRAGLALEPVWGKQTTNLAALLWEKEEGQEAIEWLERSVEVDPDPLYLLNLGLYYEQTGNLDKAWNCYAWLLVERPSWAGSEFWIALPERAEAWPEIVRRVERRKAGASPREQALFWAELAWAQGDLAEVEQQARSLVRQEPDSSSGYVWLARVLLEQGRVSKAVLAAERAVELSPHSSQALAIRGRARWRAGEDVSTEEDLQLALFLSPGAQEAYDCLAQIYQVRGETERAVWAYMRTLPRRAVSQNVEVTLYGRFVTFDLLPSLVRIRFGEREVAPWLSLAHLYEQEDRWEDAQVVYLTLLAQDPYLTGVQERLEALPLP